MVTSTSAPTARALLGPTPLLELAAEPPALLIVDPPLPEQLALGKVFIQYRTEHVRIVPVFGAGALSVSPRVGHLHITVDDSGWHFIDASGETIVVVGLPPGPHRILLELAGPTHKPMARQMVEFMIPDAPALA